MFSFVIISHYHYNCCGQTNQTSLPFLQNDSTTEDDDDGDDDDDEEVVTILPEDKYRVGSLEKMISVMAVLVEESRGERCHAFSLFRLFM